MIHKIKRHFFKKSLQKNFTKQEIKQLEEGCKRAAGRFRHYPTTDTVLKNLKKYNQMVKKSKIL